MRGPRSRRYLRPGHWEVRARVERFIEPSVLLLLRDHSVHGYELLERLSELAGDDAAVGAGNLYRVLRSLEDEGLVTSEWNADLPGPAKRTYELTAAGRRLLDRWVEALMETQDVIAAFVDRYRQQERSR